MNSELLSSFLYIYFFLNPIFIELHVQTTYDVGEAACLACSYL